MTAPTFPPVPVVRPACAAAAARFARNGLDAIAFPGAGLPRGYFCSVTPP
ncbi:hypothetical protein [uncultured Massilia sp.]|nr:hypothetical protein [uncultured Massilia sp.]